MEFRNGHLRPYMSKEDGRDGTAWGIPASRMRGEMGHFRLELTVPVWGLHPPAKHEGLGRRAGISPGWHKSQQWPL